MKEIKQQFFIYRNGAMAETLRRYGIPHKVIFGLDIPCIAEIARQIGKDEELAERLWEDSEVRESRLLAAYLFDSEKMTAERAIELARSTRTQEEADMLAFRLLKRMGNAGEVLDRLDKMTDEGAQRTATVLRRHLE